LTTRSLPLDLATGTDENSIEALQQLCGNLFSALLVPVAERAGQAHVSLPKLGGSELGDVRGDSLLLGGLAAAGFVFFSGFDAPLKRSALDCALDDVGGCDSVGELSETDQDELDAEIDLLATGGVVGNVVGTDVATPLKAVEATEAVEVDAVKVDAAEGR
tara:strand:- start:460 stop:942 length:483 start_codon:yes stop_codon:yes gene_type:complete